MSEGRTNEFGQPIGRQLDHWQSCPFPDVAVLRGRWSRVEPLLEEHTDGLYAALCAPGDDELWTYLPTGPFHHKPDFVRYVSERAEDTSTVAVTIFDAEGEPSGIANYLRIDAPNGSVEIGGIVLGKRIQHTTSSTEAFYLLARHVFDLGYRRYEWKCDALNEPSRSAAERLGFRYEGRFRNALVYKGRNRDTDWYSITDDEWPAVAAACEKWLDPGNFVDGVQQTQLRAGSSA